MSRPVLLIEIGAGPLPAVTPVKRPSGSWVPVVYKAPVVETPTGVTPTPVTDGVLLQWSPIAAADVVYIIDRGSTAEGPWVEIARTAATRYLYSDGTNVVWFFRIRASINGRAGSGNVVRVHLDMTTEKIRQNFLDAVARDQKLAEQLLGQAQELSSLQALVDAPEWTNRAWPDGAFVKYQGGLFAAKQAVPAGIEITDTRYWDFIGQYATLAEAMGAISVSTSQITNRVQQINQELIVIAKDVRGVQSSLSGKADSSVVQALTTRLTQAENSLTSLAQQISAVQSQIAGKADALALQALQTQVTQVGNEVTSQGVAITAVRSQTGSGANFLNNAAFESDTSGWSVYYNQDGGATSLTRIGPGAWVPGGCNALEIQRSQNPNLYGDFVVQSAGMSAEPGKRYCASAYGGRQRCAGEVGIAFYNADDQMLESQFSEAFNAAGGNTLSAYDRKGIFRTAPAGTVRVRMLVRMRSPYDNSSQFGPVLWIVKPAINEVAAATTVIPPWAPSAAAIDFKYAAATQSLSTRLTTTENGVASYFASWNLSLDVNGRIVGIRSVNNGTTGTIDFVFDKVRFLSPSAGGARSELVNGNYFVWAPNGVRVVALGWNFT